MKVSVNAAYRASSDEFKVIGVSMPGVEGRWNVRWLLGDDVPAEVTIHSHPAERNDWFLQPTGFRIAGVIAPEGVAVPGSELIRRIITAAEAVLVLPQQGYLENITLEI